MAKVAGYLIMSCLCSACMSKPFSAAGMAAEPVLNATEHLKNAEYHTLVSYKLLSLQSRDV